MAKYHKVRVVRNPKYGTWYLHYTNIDGRRRRLSVGENRQHAERQAILYEEWLNCGKNPEEEEERIEMNKLMTLRNLEPEFYLQHVKQLSKNTQRMHKERWKRLVECPQIVDVPMWELQKKIVRDYRKARQIRDGASNATLNRDIAKLQSMLNWAVKEGYLDRNPLIGLELLPEKDIRRVKLDVEVVDLLIESLSEMVGLIVRFAYYTGARKESILNMKVNQVKFYDIPHNGIKGHVELRVKGGGREIIPLDPRAAEVLKKALTQRTITPGSYVFENPKNGSRYDGRLSSFARTVRKLGIMVDGSPLQFHDFRRNVGTQLRHGGAGRDDIKALLTHKDPRSTERYFYDERLSLVPLLKSIPSLGKEGNNWQENGKVAIEPHSDTVNKVL